VAEEEYNVSAVKAIGSQDPNRPENVIDNEPSTRWAHQGVGSWIQLDLGEEKTPVRSVGIKWFKGDQRVYNFEIQTSTNEINFQDVITDGKSSGTAQDLERYDFPANTAARFVRVIVNGNSVNNWASIHTSRIFSKVRGVGGLTQWSSDETWNNGEDRTIEPEEGPDPKDARFVAKQLDGPFKILGDGTAEFNGKGRFYVFKEDEKSALDKKTEFLWKPNLEVSCDIRVDEIVTSQDDDDDDIPKAFINVGGCTNHFAPHNRNSNGRNYNLRAYFSRGFVGYEKETIHPVYDDEKAENFEQNEMPLGRWFTYKFRQKVVNDGENVKLEGWIDGEPLDSYTDEGEMTKLDDDDDDDEPTNEEKLQKVLDNEDSDALHGKMTKLRQVWTLGAYSGLYIRLTGTKKGAIRNITVKEI
jgi:hypothetical protein